MSNLLGKLQISCEFRDKGCKEILRLEDLNKHLDDCPFNLKICKKCFCVCKVTHNCVQELLDLNKKENQIIESLRQEKDIFHKLFDEIKEKYSQENHVLLKENVVLRKAFEDLKDEYESKIQDLKMELEVHQERSKNIPQSQHVIL